MERRFFEVDRRNFRVQVRAPVARRIDFAEHPQQQPQQIQQQPQLQNELHLEHIPGPLNERPLMRRLRRLQPYHDPRRPVGWNPWWNVGVGPVQVHEISSTMPYPEPPQDPRWRLIALEESPVQVNEISSNTPDVGELQNPELHGD